MMLFVSVEAFRSHENGLIEILREINEKLHFLTDKDKNLEKINNYGEEFKLICIIPTCIPQKMIEEMGWNERKKIWRKKQEADIRLRIDYETFIKATSRNKFLMFVDVLVKSLKIVSDKSKSDFKCDDLIKDILSALSVSEHELNLINN